MTTCVEIGCATAGLAQRGSGSKKAQIVVHVCFFQYEITICRTRTTWIAFVDIYTHWRFEKRGFLLFFRHSDIPSVISSMFALFMRGLSSASQRGLKDFAELRTTHGASSTAHVKICENQLPAELATFFNPDCRGSVRSLQNVRLGWRRFRPSHCCTDDCIAGCPAIER